jgi:hypothetical protein
MHGRRKRFVLSTVLLALVAVAAIVISSGSNAASRTLPLHGKMRNITQHFGCPDAPVPPHVCSTFDATGSLNGDGYVIVDVPPAPDLSHNGYSEAHTVIHTDKGDVRCHEGALFAAPGPDLISPFVDLCQIDGGTGIYKDATGYIEESGTFDVSQTPAVGQLDYEGTIFLAG